MGKNKKLDISLMAVALLVCTILTIITEYHLIIKPNWVKDIVCVLISFIFSWTFVFGLLKKMVLLFWAIANKKYCLDGKWYVIYHGDLDTSKYIRSGTVRLKQYMDEVKMYNLLMHTPSIQNDAVVGLVDSSPWDDDPKHRISTGSGEYVIDFENLILKGFFNLFRGENDGRIMGIDICTIHMAEPPYKSPQHLSGNFYNAEKRRDKPMAGIIVSYKDRKNAEDYIKNRLRTISKK